MCVPGAAVPLISYGRLGRLIHNIARAAVARELKHGDIVALQFEDRILHGAFILGLNHLGVVTLSTHGPVPDEIKLDAFISDRPGAGLGTGRFLLADADWIEGEGEPFVPADIAVRGSGSTCIALTSGTTGYPKACAFTDQMLLRRAERYNWVYGREAAGASRMFVDPSLSTAVGFLLWLNILSRGGMVLFRGEDAVETLQALELYRVEKLYATPAALAEFVALYEQAPELQRTFDTVITGGGYMPPALSARVRALLGPNFFASYGSTETHIVAVARSAATAHVPGAVGYVVADTRVEIVDASGNVLTPGAEGLIRVRSPHGVDGYVAEPSADVFRDGAFYPGDTGRLSADGLLSITGREKLVVNLGGEKVSPERIEQVLMAAPGVKQAAAFGVPNRFGVEELWAAVVAEPFNEAALRNHCAQYLPTAHRPVRYLAMEKLPVNVAGKIDRRRLAEIAQPTELNDDFEQTRAKWG